MVLFLQKPMTFPPVYKQAQEAFWGDGIDGHFCS